MGGNGEDYSFKRGYYICDSGLDYIAPEIKVMLKLLCPRSCQAKSGKGTSDGCPASPAAETAPPHRDAHRTDESPHHFPLYSQACQIGKALDTSTHCRAAIAQRQLLRPARETPDGRNGPPRRVRPPHTVARTTGPQIAPREEPLDVTDTLPPSAKKTFAFSTCSLALGNLLAFPTVENDERTEAPRDATP